MWVGLPTLTVIFLAITLRLGQSLNINVGITAVITYNCILVLQYFVKCSPSDVQVIFEWLCILLKQDTVNKKCSVLTKECAPASLVGIVTD